MMNDLDYDQVVVGYPILETALGVGQRIRTGGCVSLSCPFNRRSHSNFPFTCGTNASGGPVEPKANYTPSYPCKERKRVGVAGKSRTR